MAITAVKRLGPEAVEVIFEAANGCDETIFIPDVEVPGSVQLVSLQVLHLDARRNWASLGPFHDIPAGTAAVIKPTQTSSFVQLLHDPSIIVVPEKLTPHYRIKPTPLGGKYKITIGYYTSEAEWNKYLKVLQTRQRSEKIPNMHYADSQDFTIRPAG